MPFVENQSARIYWDEQGQGAPILLIMGLGYASCMWHRARPALAQQYRTLAFDNRGVGLSDVPPGPYSIATMAADAAAVLDAAVVASAHVFGVSMGGMIAQEFALQFPARTRSLILGCTSPGGSSAIRAENKVIDIMRVRGMTAEQARTAILPYIYDASTQQTLIDEDVNLRRNWLPSPPGYTAQLQATRTWEAYSRIARITAPTLIIHGRSDGLIPAGNGELIARRIPGARLVLLEHASHMFLTDQTVAALKEILAFLSSPQDREPAAPTEDSVPLHSRTTPSDIPGGHIPSSK
jgi:pimeloyl-ACP methyl ester carboxylesterase